MSMEMVTVFKTIFGENNLEGLVFFHNNKAYRFSYRNVMETEGGVDFVAKDIVQSNNYLHRELNEIGRFDDFEFIKACIVEV